MKRTFSFDTEPLDLDKVMKRLNAVSDFHAGYLAFLTRCLIDKGIVTQGEALKALFALSEEVLSPWPKGAKADMWIAGRMALISGNFIEGGDDEDDQGLTPSGHGGQTSRRSDLYRDRRRDDISGACRD